ncbi:MAG: L,D-transpeptidase family protein [Hyphomicrobiaceae bacterium]
MSNPRSRSPDVVVRALAARSRRGQVQLGPPIYRCTLGRTGRRAMKREGDGATPRGRFAVRQVFYRADRVARPRAFCHVRPLAHRDGWCDASGDRNYNRFVRHPYPASAERLWRADGLYDIVVVLGYNDRPRVQGRGSAIFMHVAHPDGTPTAGCIGLPRPQLLRLLARLNRGVFVRTDT